MRAEVGPVAASSVAAFVEHARALVDADHELPVDLLPVFAGYLDEWDALAAKGGDVVWTVEAPPEVAEYLVHAFYRIAQRVEEARTGGRGVPDRPAEAEAFYQELVRALLDTMASEGGAAAEFADHLRSFWPGRTDF